MTYDESFLSTDQDLESVPISALNQFLYCSRRAALIHTEGIFVDNVHTLLGNIVHKNADFPGYEVAKGVTLLRALPVWSDRLRLTGKCDIVERHADGIILPVEYKKGERKQFINDDVQLCAQALCLEEMFSRHIDHGAIFHSASKRRRVVVFTTELRILTEKISAELYALLASRSVPPAVFKAQCEGCSLHQVCLPELTSNKAEIERASRQLFQTE